MLKNLYLPANIALLAAALSVPAIAEDRFVVKVDGDVNQVARRHNLSGVKSLTGSVSGVHVLSAHRGSDAQHVLRSLAQEAGVRSAESEKPMLLPGLSSRKNLNPAGSRLAGAVKIDGTPIFYYNSFVAASYVNHQA